MNTLKNLHFTAGILMLGFWTTACRPEPKAPAGTPAGGTEAAMSVTLTPESVRTAGIRTADAGLRPVVPEIHVPGEIMFNPKRTAHVAARTAGRIEKLFAYQGDKVLKGQALTLFYSKDFLSLQAELLQALDRSKRNEPDAAEQKTSRTLLESARNRIRLLDVPDDELAEIEKTGQVNSFLTIRTPIGGSVIESLVNTGDYVESGVDLFRLADLSTVWGNLHIFEKDLAAVGVGSESIIRAAAFPGRTFEGRVFQMGNVVDEKTRTVEARVDLANPTGDLRPGMYVDADVRSAGRREAFGVPSAAVLDFRKGQAVFVRAGEGVFVLREVKTGVSAAGFTEILSGLKPGETVVTDGSFFLKSELLKNSMGEE
jgi:membrane fusion protein, copper/silver efflux system